MKAALLTACIASCLFLSSCIYSDLGRTVGSAGTKVPRIVPRAENEGKSSYCGQLYRKEGRYYVALPLAWVPERRKGYEFFPLYTAGDPFNDHLTYNRPYRAAELRQYPTEPEYFEALEPLIARFPQADANGAVGYLRAGLRPAPDFTPEGAEELGLHGVAGAAHHIGHLDKRYAWYHYPLLPLQAVATVADVALSAVLMPVSFSFFAVYECSPMLEVPEFATPWYDDSGISLGGPLIPEYDTGIIPPDTMAGQCLILGHKRYDFPRDDEVKRTLNGLSCYHWYEKPHKESFFRSAFFTETEGKVRNRWQLFFSTPTSGVAIVPCSMYEKRPTPKPRPFRIEKLPSGIKFPAPK